MYLLAALALIEGIFFIRHDLISGLGPDYYALLVMLTVLLVGVAAFASLYAGAYYQKVAYMPGPGLYIIHITAKAPLYVEIADAGIFGTALMLVVYIGMPTTLGILPLFEYGRLPSFSFIENDSDDQEDTERYY